MSAGGGSPVHRCAFPTGPDDAADLAAQVCRSALAAGSPVLAYLDPDVRDRVAGQVPRTGGVAFRPQADLARVPTDELVESWTAVLAGDGAAWVTVLCQQPFDLLPDVERWRTAEVAVTAAVAGRPVALTCLFDETRTPDADRHMARATHPALLLDGTTLANPDHRPSASVGPDGGRVLAEAVLDPATPTGNRAWWHEQLRRAGVEGSRHDELVLLLHEAVTTVATAGGGRRGVPVRLWAADGTVGCDVLTPRSWSTRSPTRQSGGHGRWREAGSSSGRADLSALDSGEP
ncbi:MEDS domain-containing protein [Geodermatophilus chilensis]|uniref:MEDS domain-containing protein n=1 Tax=Geodermatophilus chilensis TaxID=2035835 RepID=UPI000C268C16|nr:MEDS domain-containing protein [Geodermatophilus chilensis]